MQAELADVLAIEEADAVQESEKGDRKSDTAAQRTALEAPDAWTSRFTGIVVPALKDRLDLMAKMG